MTSGKPYTIGESVLGAAHAAQGKPCQDALHIHRAPGYVLLCVADGHGSSRCPYSDEGARAAVTVAAELLAAMLDNTDEAFANLDAHKEIWLPKRLEESWKARVRQLHGTRGEAFAYELYGTTLLALALTPRFVFALQIGDGDMLAIGADAPADWLIPPTGAVGGETESLCMDNCWQYVRARILPLTDADGPRLFLLATDGYSNSFTETAGFLQAGQDIYDLWRGEGEDCINLHLRDWLLESTAKGSGDDITVALAACR